MPITVIHKLTDEGNTLVITDDIGWCKNLTKK